MKGKASKIILVILIILVMLSVFIAGTMIAMPVLKKKDVTIAKDQTDKIKHSYANEDTSSSDSQEITRNYEVKEEETWDVSKNQNGSVMAKWTLSDKTIRISGSGEMKNWGDKEKNDWHGTQYTNVIKNVIIEDSVINIGNYTFYKCNNLKKVEIPNRVTSIGDEAFSECSSLASIEIPSSVTSIGYGAFSRCSSLASIEIPSSVTSIGYAAFYRCSSLASIEIPSSVTSIESEAFLECSSLKEIKVDNNNEKYVDENGILYNKNKTSLRCYPAGKIEKNFMIPSSVTNIENFAFYGCSSLASIEIPSSVTSIEEYAFSGCSSLASIEIPSSVTSIGYNAFYGCSSLASIEIPSSVTSIGYGAFYGCSSLVSVEIPSVTSIGSYAFYGCSSLASVKIPESVTSIGDNAFNGCSSFTSIEIPSSVTSIGDDAFYGCSSLASVKIPESVTSIGSYAFCRCSSLENIEIPSSVTYIEIGAIPDNTVIYVQADTEGHKYAEEKKHAYVLSGEANSISTNYKIEEVKMGDISEKQDGSVIAKWTLSNKTLRISGTGKMKSWTSSNKDDWAQYTMAIKNVIIEDSVINIGNDAFYECSNLESIKIPSSVTSIGESAFYGCSSLASIEIPSSVTSIENYAFYGCRSLTSIEIPSGVTSIGVNAFNGCSSLTSIEIPSSVMSIGVYAFWGCSSLASIEIPNSVTSIGSKAFYKCDSLKEIKVDNNNETYVDENGILYDKNKTRLECYPAGKMEKKFMIPSSVTNIENYAFYGCSSLASIEIPSSVTRVGDSAFYGCSSLVSIEIPSSVTRVGDSAFYGCSSLASIEIPSSVTSIGKSAFYGCSSLSSIEIPSSVTRVGDSAFYGCSSLASIEIPSSVTSIGYGAFYGCSSLSSIEIPSSVTSIVWGTFKGCSSLANVEIPNSMTSIGDSAFWGCSSLISIEIPGSVTSIGDSAFYGCSSLSSIKIPSGVTSIGWGTFRGCSSLANVEIPNSITSIGERAFLDCKSLESIVLPGTITNIGEAAISSSTLIYTKLNGEGHRYAEEGEQGYIIDDEAPTVTFDPIGNESTQKQHSTKIKIKDNMVGINEEKLKYQWTQSEETPSQESFTQNFENEQTITKDTGDGNWYLWIYAEDKVGNVTVTRSNAFNFDNTPPVTNVEYSTTRPTRENIIVTIKSNEPIQEVEGWKLSEDKMSLIKEYENNTTANGEIIEIKDLAGNSATATIKITNIDREAPKPEVKYSTNDLTNQNVVATIKSNEQIQAVEGWKLSEDKMSLTKEYANNTTARGEVIEVKDLAGNSATVTIKITNIDKEAPKPEVKYSITEITEQNVIVTVTSNEQIQEIEGWKLSEDKMSLTREYENNTTANGEVIEVKDLAGNSTKVTVKIQNIQKEFETDQYKIVNSYIVKIKPNTTYNEFIKNIQTNQTYTVKEGSKVISGTNTIKTGQVLTTQTGKQYTLVVMGDLNGDGKIGIIELARISKIGSGKIKDYKEIEKMAIDANADGKINILDLAVIAKLATGKQ